MVLDQNWVMNTSYRDSDLTWFEASFEQIIYNLKMQKTSFSVIAISAMMGLTSADVAPDDAVWRSNLDEAT